MFSGAYKVIDPIQSNPILLSYPCGVVWQMEPVDGCLHYAAQMLRGWPGSDAIGGHDKKYPAFH